MSAFSGDLGVLRWVIEGDDSPLDAKLNSAEAKVRAWAARMANVTVPLGGAGTTTFSGNVSPANAAAGLTAQGAPWGAASPNWSFLLGASGPTSSPNWSMLLSQQAQQITAGAAGLMPTSSPNWSYYFGQLQNQIAATAPTSSPNWSYLLNQGRGGGGGPATPTQRAVRASLVYHFGQQVANEALQAEEAHYEFQRVLSRGTLDQQVAAGVAAAKSYDTGLTGFLSRHPVLSTFIVPGASAAINYFQGGSTEDIRDAVENAALASSGQKATDAARRTTQRMGRGVQAIGMTAYRASVNRAYDEYDEGMDEVRDLRAQALKLTGENNQTANALTAEADSRQKVLERIFGTTLAARTQSHGLQIAGRYAARGIRAFGGAIEAAGEMSAAVIAVGGDEFAAQRALTVAQYAQQEAGAPNAISRLAMRAYHGTMLWTQDAIHERELTEGAEDLEVSAAELGARNPFLAPTAAYSIKRRALQNRKDLALARYHGNARGRAALANAYDSQTDLLDQQAAMEEQQQGIENQTQLQVGALTLARQPRAAAIAAIRGGTQQRVLSAGVDQNGLPSIQALIELAKGAQQEQLENQRQDDNTKLINMRLGGEAEVLAAMLGRTSGGDVDPATAGMSPLGRGMIGGFVAQRVQGEQQAEQLRQGGHWWEAVDALNNAKDRLDLMQQNLTQNVQARGVNLNLTDVQHPETNTQDLLKALDQQRKQLVQDLDVAIRDAINNAVN